MYLQQSAPVSPHTPSTRSSSRSSSMHLVEYDYDEPKPAKKLLAKATFDNIAESTDELAFRKGEILTVIETDTNGLKGWWLCQLRGRQGICPGNRLKIIQSHDSGCFTLSPASSPCPTIDSTTNLNSPIPSEIYENTSLCSSTSAGSQRQGKRRSWHIMPNKLN
uniref:SH3 domain-containing protein n=1 Tax=Anopheles merus TaxID=30066 RepID=A0A182VIS0_ANOME